MRECEREVGKQMAYVNPLRKLLSEKEFVIGTGYYTREPAIAEMLAGIYDFIWIDWEHTWLDRRDIVDGLIACRAGGAPAIVRIPWNDPVLAKPILEMGPDGIIFPQIHNVEEAKLAIASCIYPPKGIRGWGPGRAVGFGELPARQYIDESPERIFKILQVENLECIEALDEILDLTGMDCLCVGPMDLSASVGRLAQTRDPDVLRAYDRVGEIAARHNVPLMLSYGFNPQEIREWVDRGARLLHVNGDLGFIRNAARYEYQELQRLVGNTQEPAQYGGVSQSAI